MAIQEALDALLLLPDQVHLAFVGRNYDSSLEDIQGRDLADRVHVVPPVLPNEVVPFIRTADAALILYFPWSVNYEKRSTLTASSSPSPLSCRCYTRISPK